MSEEELKRQIEILQSHIRKMTELWIEQTKELAVYQAKDNRLGTSNEQEKVDA